MTDDKKNTNDTRDLLYSMGIDNDIIAGIASEIDAFHIAQRLVIARARANLTQQELADKIGKPVKFVDMLENTCNEDMRVGDIKAYAKGLGFDGVDITLFHKGTRDGH